MPGLPAVPSRRIHSRCVHGHTPIGSFCHLVWTTHIHTHNSYLLSGFVAMFTFTLFTISLRLLFSTYTFHLFHVCPLSSFHWFAYFFFFYIYTDLPFSRLVYTCCLVYISSVYTHVTRHFRCISRTFLTPFLDSRRLRLDFLFPVLLLQFAPTHSHIPFSPFIFISCTTSFSATSHWVCYTYFHDISFSLYLLTYSHHCCPLHTAFCNHCTSHTSSTTYILEQDSAVSFKPRTPVFISALLGHFCHTRSRLCSRFWFAGCQVRTWTWTHHTPPFSASRCILRTLPSFPGLIAPWLPLLVSRLTRTCPWMDPGTYFSRFRCMPLSTTPMHAQTSTAFCVCVLFPVTLHPVFLPDHLHLFPLHHYAIAMASHLFILKGPPFTRLPHGRISPVVWTLRFCHFRFFQDRSVPYHSHVGSTCLPPVAFTDTAFTCAAGRSLVPLLTVCPWFTRHARILLAAAPFTSSFRTSLRTTPGRSPGHQFHVFFMHLHVLPRLHCTWFALSPLWTPLAPPPHHEPVCIHIHLHIRIPRYILFTPLATLDVCGTDTVALTALYTYLSWLV